MRYRFGDFTLDVDRQCLTLRGREIDLRPKAFQLLQLLLEKSGRVVNKEELVGALWPKTTVTDESLTQCVSSVRKAIGDQDQQMLRTLPRRGYLFAGTVTQEKSDGLLLAGDLSHRRSSVVVLPFENVSLDRSQNYLGRGIAEDIATELSRFTELRVIASQSALRSGEVPVDVRQVGREFGAQFILSGSIRRAGDRLRISTYLIDVETAAHRWAERYDRDIEDVFALQDDVVRTIVSVLASHVNRSEIERTSAKPPTTWQAYDYYLQGAEAYSSFHRDMTADRIHTAREHLSKCIALDPSFGPAHIVLSTTSSTIYNLPLFAEHLDPKVLKAAHRSAVTALQLEPNSPKGHAQLGYVLIFMRQPDLAVSQFERAMALNPNFSDWRYPLALMMAGDSTKAVEVAQSHLRLDPFALPIARGYLGLAYYMLKEYENALPVLRQFVSLAPNHTPGHLWLASTYAQIGRRDLAHLEAAEVLRIDPRWTIRRFEPLGPFKRSEDAFHFFDGMRKAELPEG